jgi:transposase
VPWSEKSIMSQRGEFLRLFAQEGVDRWELCRRFGVSPTTGYRLLARYRQEGEAGLADRSRRPLRSPAPMEDLVLGVREENPAWGGRKIRRRLQDLGHQGVPRASTITVVLHRNGKVISMPGPVASGGSDRRVGLAPTGKRRLVTTHVDCGPSASPLCKVTLKCPR